MPKILHTAHYSDRALELLKASAPTGFTVETLDEPTRDCLLSRAADADYFLVSGRLKIDSVVLERAAHLKMIQRTGVGTEMLDLAAITRQRVPVYVNRGVNARSVAEHTVMLILACLKNLQKISGEVKKGIWQKQESGLSCRELYGKTVGLVGFGMIGRLVSEMLNAFGARVVYFDIAPTASALADAQRLGVERVDSFEKLLVRSDVISFHCPLSADTAQMLSATAIEKMKDGACVVNTARGGIVDEVALANALQCGKIRAAALDVRAQEPPLSDDPLAQLDNVILTPHIAGLSREAFSDMLMRAMSNIAAFERGELESIEKYRLVVQGELV